MSDLAFWLKRGDILPFTVVMTASEHTEFGEHWARVLDAEKWCEENLGEQWVYSEDGTWDRHLSCFRFRDQAAAVEFKMRFG